jgi:hypothetical protein
MIKSLELSTELNSAADFDPLSAYEHGTNQFASMMVRWMDGNSWSHPIIIQLGKACMGDREGWLHSSQISNLRAGKTRNPGPRTFVAIERLNYYLYRFHAQKALIPNTKKSNHYVDALPITDGGLPPSLGWFNEVFTGYRLITSPDLKSSVVPPEQAAIISKRLGRLLRERMIIKELDIVEDVSSMFYTYYPTKEKASFDRIHSLLMGQALNAKDLQHEMPNLAHLLTKLGLEVDHHELLTKVRR